MALPESSSKDQGSKANDQDDKDFDPTPEALIDEIDDERTLEEEEALDGNNGVAVQEELDDLKKESEMPIEELLAYYERMRNQAQEELNSDEEEDEEEEDEDEDEEDEEEDGDNDADRGDKHDERRRKDRGGKGAESHSDQRPSVDSTSNPPPSKTANDSKPSQSSDGGGGGKSSANQTHHRHRYLPNCGIMDSDAHSTTNNSTATDQSSAATVSAAQHQQQQQQTSPAVATSAANQVVECSQSHACDVTDSSSADVGRERHRHSMTDYIHIDDEAGGMFKTLLGYDLDDSDDMDEDYSYTDDENCDDERDWRKVIHVGPDFQADVPEGLSEYDDVPPYENRDKLIWKCDGNLTQERILDYLKQASLLSKRNDISISPASVPKISSDSTRVYRERMQDITSSTGSHTVEHNHENIIIELPAPSNLPDVYMSQSRKRARIDYELEQENTMDGINQACGGSQNQHTSSREDNSDSTSHSQDARVEPSTEEYFQDEEQLLFLLLQCNYNLDEALRRRKLDPFKYYLHGPMSLWSQEECLGFEHGLRVYGKDFRSIRENKVQTRTHAEVVAFYYLWKKSERHDVYTNQYKIDRKRCLNHPGTTDYMDKFIEDNESNLNASSSTTPTPTEGNVAINSNVDSVNGNNSTTNLWHPSVLRFTNHQQ